MKLGDSRSPLRPSGKNAMPKVKEMEFDGEVIGNPVSPGGSEFDTSEIFKQIELESELHIPWWDRQLQANPGLRTVWEYSVSPNTPRRLTWDVLVLLLVIYSSFWDPYTAAFAVVNLDDDPNEWTPERVQLYIIDAIFWLDILISFHTGYDKGFEIIMDKGRIIRNYGTGWFWIDLMATVPWDWLIGTIMEIVMAADTVAGEGTGTSLANQIKDSPLVRLLRLARVLRLARASRLINRLFQSKTVHSGYVEAVKFFTYVSVVAHLLACFFFMWPMLTDCQKDRDVADAAFLHPSSSTEGWHWNLPGDSATTCMQNSWRQGYGLETVCPIPTDDDGGEGVFVGHIGDWKLRVCQETAERGLDPKIQNQNWISRGKLFDYGSVSSLCSSWPADAVYPDDLPEWQVPKSLQGKPFPCPYNTTFTTSRCQRCWSPRRLYVDSLYWSLTTMTTIGYGDRGPSTEGEINFVMFAEVFGLAFFALLLRQVDSLYDIVNETSAHRNDRKNQLVSFCKLNKVDDSHTGVDQSLLDDIVRFLSFQSSVLSGNAYDDDDPRFAGLSPELRRRIHVAVNRPYLQQVRMFGWSKTDVDEEEMLKRLFDNIDADGSGELCSDEMKELFVKLDIALAPDQFDQCFAEMSRGDDSVDYSDFRRWWNLKKWGHPGQDQCPEYFLNELAVRMTTLTYSSNEVIIPAGEYGRSLALILAGQCEVIGTLKERGDKWLIESSDREPAFGFQAALPYTEWKYVRRKRTRDWEVNSHGFVDTAWLTREDIMECYHLKWAEGESEIIDICFDHYELDPEEKGAEGEEEDDDGDELLVGDDGSIKLTKDIDGSGGGRANVKDDKDPEVLKRLSALEAAVQRLDGKLDQKLGLILRRLDEVAEQGGADSREGGEESGEES